jgi:glutamate formiminotransferase/formiminotetrahydrofolate cyclodeaminase
VGLIPKKVLIDAADYYLLKQERSTGISEKEKIKIAIKTLGLNDLAPFNPEEKVIEFVLSKLEPAKKRLIDMNLVAFADETASESPAPGGGSISAYCGVLGVSLGTMVANLSAHKRGWDHRWKEFSDWAEKGMRLQQELLRLVDEDTASFNAIMDAFAMPKDSPEEKLARKSAIQKATKYAIEIPFKVAQISLQSIEVMKAMAESGNPNSITDAGVGAMCARTAVLGAIMNVKINVGSYEDKTWTSKILEDCMEMEQRAQVLELEIRELVERKINA